MPVEPLIDDDVGTVAAWLARPDVHRWLDFGRGRQTIPAAGLMLMLRQDAQRLWLVSDDDRRAVGVAALADINPVFRSATLWYVIGDPRALGRGHATRAVNFVLEQAFGPLALHSVQAWSVEANLASIRVLEKNGFRTVGRQRACHVIDGQFFDRVLFDRIRTDG